MLRDPFDQQQNMLWPTTEYFIKTCLFCCHDQQQNADMTNSRMLHYILIKYSVVYSVVDQMDNLCLYPVLLVIVNA